MVSAASNKYSSSGANAVKPKEGRNTYRILWAESAPWIGEDGQFWADVGVHWIKADDNGKPIAVVGDCDICFQQPSVINAAIEAAISSAYDEETKKLYEGWKARKSVLLNVLERTGGATPEDSVVLELTPTTYGKVMSVVELYLQAGQNILDSNEGVDIIITRTGKGLQTNYDVAVAPGVSKPVLAATIQNATNLRTHIEKNFFRGEEQKALNAIAQIAGVAVPRLGSSTSATTPTAALTAPSVAVEDAVIEEAPAPKPVVKKPVAVAEVVDPIVDAAAEKRAAILARQAKAAAEAEAELAALEEAEAAPAEAAEDILSSLPSDEQDAILAELDALK